MMFVATLDSKKVGKTIAFFRNQKGLSQEVLSGLADIGRSHLSAIERGNESLLWKHFTEFVQHLTLK